MDGLCKIYLPYYLISAGVCKHEDLNIGTTSKILGSEAANKNTIAAQERENQSQKANSVPKPKLKQTQAN